MDKLNSIVTLVISCFGIVFIGLIVYVSILGDNHKIDYLVNQFFTDIQQRKFDSVCTVITPELTSGMDSGESCLDFCFLLELSMLQHFSLENRNDYNVEIKKSHFWIPYLSPDTISVSVGFTEKHDNLVKNFFQEIPADTYIKDLILIERKRGGWKIKQLTIGDASLAERINTLKTTLDLETYIKATENGYILNHSEINSKQLTPTERKLLEFSIFKLSKSGTKETISKSLKPEPIKE